MIVYAVLFNSTEYINLEGIFNSRKKALEYVLSQGKYEQTKEESWYVEKPSNDMYEIRMVEIK